MTDNVQVAEVKTAEGQEPQTDVNGTVETFDRAYVERLRQEAAGYRTKLTTFEQQQKEAEEKRLKEQNEWRQLAEQRQREIEDLSPFKTQYEQVLETLKGSNEKRINQIPEQMRSLVPDFEDPARLAAWLDVNAAKLKLPTAPSLDGGAGSNERKTAVTLTDAELRTAQKMGISAEDYLKNKG